jgi:DNA ligase-1
MDEKMSTYSEKISALSAVGSRLAKEKNLAEFCKDPGFVKLLKLTYSPDYVYGVKKMPKLSKFGNEELDVNRLEELLMMFHNRELTGNAAQDALVAFCKNLVEEDVNLVANVLKGDLRCGVNTSTINKIVPGLIPTYPYMRCSLQAGSNFDKFDWNKGVYSQYKADGMFASIHVTNEGVKIQSRSGSVFHNSQFENLVSNITKITDGEKVYNGELIVEQDGVVLAREIGNGILNSVLKGGAFQENQKAVYIVWDVIPKAQYVSKGKYNVPYSTRFKELSEFEDVRKVETRIVHSPKEAFEHYLEVISGGGEGTVIKSADGIWADGTSKDQVKVKIEAEVDLEVIGFREGNGKHASTFGSLTCRTSDGKLVTNVSGFKDEMRQRIFEEKWWELNKIVTVKANDIMYATNKEHALFLPRFVEERLDKKEADSFEKVEQIFKEVKNGFKA